MPKQETPSVPIIVISTSFENAQYYSHGPWEGKSLSYSYDEHLINDVDTLGATLELAGQGIKKWVAQGRQVVANENDLFCTVTPRIARLSATSTWSGLMKETLKQTLDSPAPLANWAAEVGSAFEKQYKKSSPMLRRKVRAELQFLAQTREQLSAFRPYGSYM